MCLIEVSRTPSWRSPWGELPSDNGQPILAYAAEPGSPSEEALKRLVSWTATLATGAQEARDQMCSLKARLPASSGFSPRDCELGGT